MDIATLSIKLSDFVKDPITFCFNSKESDFAKSWMIDNDMESSIAILESIGFSKSEASSFRLFMMTQTMTVIRSLNEQELFLPVKRLESTPDANILDVIKLERFNAQQFVRKPAHNKPSSSLTGEKKNQFDNAKNRVLEYCQKWKCAKPVFNTSETGPSNERKFETQTFWYGSKFSSSGFSKVDSEKACCLSILNWLENSEFLDKHPDDWYILSDEEKFSDDELKLPDPNKQIIESVPKIPEGLYNGLCNLIDVGRDPAWIQKMSSDSDVVSSKLMFFNLCLPSLWLILRPACTKKSIAFCMLANSDNSNANALKWILNSGMFGITRGSTINKLIKANSYRFNELALAYNYDLPIKPVLHLLKRLMWEDSSDLQIIKEFQIPIAEICDVFQTEINIMKESLNQDASNNSIVLFILSMPLYARNAAKSFQMMSLWGEDTSGIYALGSSTPLATRDIVKELYGADTEYYVNLGTPRANAIHFCEHLQTEWWKLQLWAFFKLRKV
jgi:hypothetical protein